jgi:hypothetical protein
VSEKLSIPYASFYRTLKSMKDLLVIQEGNRPIFVTFKGFQLMLLDEEEKVGKQALYHHILLSNPTDFWKSVSHAIQKRKIPRKRIRYSNNFFKIKLFLQKAENSLLIARHIKDIKPNEDQPKKLIGIIGQ